jgi:regulator of sigma E protease
MLSTIIFIVVLGVLVLVHEFGHFITAKKAGLKVEEFGFGFPPRLWGIKRGETIYSINWIPFGGFVKIFGEDGGHKEDKKSFSNTKPGKKALIISAGVVMNFLLAVVFLSIGNAIGLRVGIEEKDILDGRAVNPKIQIIGVAPNSPAQQSGLGVLDEIVGFRIDGQEKMVKTVSDVQNIVSQNLGKEIFILIENGNNLIEKKVIPRESPPANEGALGISLGASGIIKYPIHQAIGRGAYDAVMILEQTIIGYATLIKNVFISGKPGMELTGPIGIAVVTGRAARLGIAYLMQFTSLISINLAVLNFLPFPALDGGRLIFIIIEKIRRKAVPVKIENAVNTAGFALLIILMIYITTKDMIKFF